MKTTTQNSTLLAEWNFSAKTWNDFVSIEKKNKREDNIYFGIGIAILGTLALMYLRDASLLHSLLVSIPLAILIPLLRYKLTYKHLKKRKNTSNLKIFTSGLVVNNKTISFIENNRFLKAVTILKKGNFSLIEFDISWKTRNGYTNDEFRLPIPNDKLEEANAIVNKFYATQET